MKKITAKDQSNLDALQANLGHVHRMLTGLREKPKSELTDRLIANKLEQKAELERFIEAIEKKYS